MPEVLQADPLPRLLQLLLSGLLSLILGFLSKFLGQLEGSELLRPLLNSLDSSHHLGLLLIEQANAVLQGLRVLVSLLLGTF